VSAYIDIFIHNASHFYMLNILSFALLFELYRGNCLSPLWLCLEPTVKGISSVINLGFSLICYKNISELQIGFCTNLYAGGLHLSVHLTAGLMVRTCQTRESLCLFGLRSSSQYWQNWSTGLHHQWNLTDMKFLLLRIMYYFTLYFLSSCVGG